MNYVVAMVLESLNFQEELSFWFLIQLFNRRNLKEIYDTNTSKYKLLTYQTEALLMANNPKLAIHLCKLGFDSSMYCVKWFFSLFAIDLPKDFVKQIFDFLLYE